MTRPTRIGPETTAGAEAVLIDIDRRMPTWRKIELVDDAIGTRWAPSHELHDLLVHALEGDR